MLVCPFFSLVGIHSMGAGAALRKLTDIHVISTFSVLLFKCVVDFIFFNQLSCFIHL